MNDNNFGGKITVFGFNLLAGCLKGGIAAALDKRAVWSACGKGSVGGAIAFAGEYVVSYNQYPFVGGAGKLIHDVGISMSDNVMRGEGFFSQFQTDVGPLNLTFRDSYVPKVMVTHGPFYGIGHALFNGNRFDLKQSIYNFTPIFIIPELQQGHTIRGRTAYISGRAIGNVIEYVSPTEQIPGSLSHELNHALFWRKLRFINELFHPFSDTPILKWWDMNQDFSLDILWLPTLYSASWFLYNPLELEARAMKH